jgi:long-subunit fatty acid transport protein
MQFLKIGLGARPAAMGEAFTGLADDVDAIAWNPAGLTSIEGMQQTFMHTAWLEGINIEYAAFAGRINPVSTFGVGIEYVNFGDIDYINKYGNTLGAYNAYDLMGTLSYARQLRPNLSAGANVKILQEKIEKETARGFALDVGALYRASSRLQLGFTLQNAGTAVTFREVSSPMPLTMRLGAAYQLRDNITLASDVNVPSDSAPSLHVGGEYLYTKIKDTQLAARCGFRTNTMSALGALSGISFGLGVPAQLRDRLCAGSHGSAGNNAPDQHNDQVYRNRNSGGSSAADGRVRAETGGQRKEKTTG